MNCKARVQIWNYLLLLVFLLIPLHELYAQQDKVAALKQALAENQKQLRQYQWVETTIVSLKGEEKSRVQKQCSYGPDGKVHKQQISAPPKQQSQRGLKGKVVEKKKEEITDYMKHAVALVNQYVPPDAQLIQAAKDAGHVSMTPEGAGVVRLDFASFVKPGDKFSLTINGGTNAMEKINVNSYLDSQKDAVTLNVSFASLNTGVAYPANIQLLAPEKNIQVVVQNSDYRMIASAAQAPPPQPSAAFAQDPGWPRETSHPDGKLVTYPPQADDWKNFKELSWRQAFSITPTGGKKVVGAASFVGTTDVDTEHHMVLITNLKIVHISFPSLDPDSAAKMEQLVGTFVPPAVPISLDRVVASVQKPETVSTVNVKNDPPPIFVSYSPAILLVVDGDPVLADVPKTSLKFVVNTDWPLFFEKSKSQYFLLAGEHWLVASDLNGPWTAAKKLPEELSKLPAEDRWADVKKMIPPPAQSKAIVPKVFYSATPAEVILFEGKPAYTKIAGTELAYANNTDSPVFLDSATNESYFLTAGRWFKAKDMAGPWKFASSELPPDFARIPSTSPASAVLASVPGTEEAKDAVLIAQIPTVMEIDPKAAAAQAKVSYTGDPQFAPIEGTSLKYATNTQDKVIKVGDVYYLCLQGVWFMSVNAQGPWTTASSVPQEIYTIPASSPVYNVTYVTQVTTTSGSVQSSYTAGYLGVFVMGAAVGAVIANGSGYYYPPYVGYPVYGYPVYRPYPTPYGGKPYYNTATGAYGVAQTVYGPNGSATRAASYNPYTGTYKQGASVSTPYGSKSVGQAYNPYTGTYGATRQGSSPTAQWGQSAVSNGNSSAYAQHYSTAQGTVGNVQGSGGGKAVGASTAYGNSAVGKSSSGDVYAGHDGNVYKNTGSGWQKYDNNSGSWNTVNTPQNQQQAQQQKQNYQQQRSTTPPPTSAGVQPQAQQQRQTQQQPQSTAGQQPSAAAPQRTASGQQGNANRSSEAVSSQSLNQEKENRQRGASQSQNYRRSQARGGSGGGSRRR